MRETSMLAAFVLVAGALPAELLAPSSLQAHVVAADKPDHHRVTESSCDSTVAYTFLAASSLPLWPVWQSYFAGCPAGSFTVVVHTQQPGSTIVNVSSVGGRELSPGRT
eukprot:4560850-Prymnesium_polylepis.1